ncbi:MULTISPECIES: SRPBCC family protein [unclassified Streptomyces]|uniref:SRPBCC family protein n=1 Tax=unclassified Streptomyces TaxID=2593676 RepID=UPI00382713AE
MKLLYRGPNRQDLHDQFAKRRRIDADAPVVSVSEMRIEAPPERVWEIIADPSGWSSVLPGRRIVRLDNGVTQDAEFIWAMGRATITSRFAVVDEGRELTWTGVAMGVKAVDRQVLTATPDGGTVLRVEESMAAPLVRLVFSPGKLRAQHEIWMTAVKAAAERAVRAGAGTQPRG